MTQGNNITIQIENSLGASLRLTVNGTTIKPGESAGYQIAPSAAVTIQRQGISVSVTLPGSEASNQKPSEGICMCLSSNVAFTLMPTASLHLSLQSGYVTPDRIGVRCGDG